MIQITYFVMEDVAQSCPEEERILSAGSPLIGPDRRYVEIAV